MSLGYNVLYVAENNHGIPDTDVLDMAVKNKAILITRDSDFGELIFFLWVRVKDMSLIYIRADMEKVDTVIFDVLKNTKETGEFIVVGMHTIRKKKL